MIKKLFTSLMTVIFVLGLISCTNKLNNNLGGKEMQNTEKVVCVYNVSQAFKTDYKAYMSLKAVQGLVNRKGHNLYLMSSEKSAYPFNDTDKQWYKVMKESGYTFKELKTVSEVYITFKDYFKGLIISDGAISYSDGGFGFADTDFACMVASVSGYAPVPANIASAIKNQTRLSVVEEVTIGDFKISGEISKGLKKLKITKSEQVFDLAFEKLLKTKQLTQDAVMAMVNEGMDYAVKKKIMYYSLMPDNSEAEKKVFDKIMLHMSATNKQWNMYGWVPEESTGLKTTSKHGGVIDCIADGNLSLLSSLPGPTALKQKAKSNKTFDPKKIYITFMASENDTIKNIQSFQHGAWFDPNRGKLPVNWGAIADSIDEFPFVIDYLYKTATENDYFFSGGGSALGFVDPDEDMPKAARDELEKKNKKFLTLTDQKYMDFYTDTYTPDDKFTPSQVATYMKNSGINNFISRVNSIADFAGIWEKDVFFYNRGKNMYPRRAVDDTISRDDLEEGSENLWTDDRNDNYIYLDIRFKMEYENEYGAKLFTQKDGSSYIFKITNDKGILSKKIGIKETVLANVDVEQKLSNKFIAIADRSTPTDKETTLKFYFNGKEIAEIEDKSLSSGGYAVFTTGKSLEQIFEGVRGTNISQPMQIAQSILSDDRQFIVGFYGYLFDRKYSNNQMENEPGFDPQDVITLSPTTLLKVMDIINNQKPNIYEVVNLDEFMTFSRKYYENNSTILY